MTQNSRIYLFEHGNRQKDGTYEMKYLDIDNAHSKRTHAIGITSIRTPTRRGCEEMNGTFQNTPSEPITFYTGEQFLQLHLEESSRWQSPSTKTI